MDRGRLAQLLGMLGSSHDGEVVNAGRLAVRMLKQAGVTWQQLLAPTVNGHNESVVIDAARALLAENDQLKDEVEDLRDQLRRARQRSLQTPNSWGKPRSTADKIEQALSWVAVLSDWEREFTVSIAGHWRLTEKQQARLDAIILKIERIARARGIAA